MWLQPAEVNQKLQIKRYRFQSDVTDTTINKIAHQRAMLHGHEEEIVNLGM